MARGIKINTSNNSNFISMEDALNKFLIHCEIRNLSSRTIKTYKDVNNEFICFFGNHQVNSLTKNSINEFILYSKQKGNSNNYINTKLRQIRAFIYWCQKEYDLKEFKIELIKVSDENKEPYSKEELKLLLHKPITSNFVEWRNWAHINFFLGTGCRLSTSLEVKVKDIDFENKTIFFSTLKNRKQQYIPLSHSLECALKEYLSLWQAENDDYIFPTYERTKMTPRTAQSSLKKYNYDRGVTKTGIHRFRHTFAKEYILNGGQALQLQQILGHSTLEMTKRYVNLYSTDLQINFDKFCALDNIK